MVSGAVSAGPGTSDRVGRRHRQAATGVNRAWNGHFWNTLQFSRRRVTVAQSAPGGPRRADERTSAPWNSGSSTPSASCPGTARPTAPSAEHDRMMDEVAFIQAADAAGFQVHLGLRAPLPDRLLAPVGQRVVPGVLRPPRPSNIHIGSGIFNITPPANHPARIAERVAMLDHLSEGRFEFGTGRGSSTTEQRGFGIEDPELTREMVAETLPQIVRMWKDEDYSLRRPVLLDADAQRPAQALHRAAPADLDGGRAARARSSWPPARRRRAVLRLRTPDRLTPAHRQVQGDDRERRPGGGYINNNVMITTQMICMEDGGQGPPGVRRLDANYHLSLVFRYLDTFPKPKGIPDWPEVSSGRHRPSRST